MPDARDYTIQLSVNTAAPEVALIDYTDRALSDKATDIFEMFTHAAIAKTAHPDAEDIFALTIGAANMFLTALASIPAEHRPAFYEAMTGALLYMQKLETH